MRGYLIDVIEGKTHSVDVFDLEDYQKFIHCQTIDIVSRTIGDREYEIICDDEGLSKRPALVSAVNNDGQPMLVGNLIVMGNSGGDEDMHEISFDEIQHLKKHFMHVVTKGSGKSLGSISGQLDSLIAYLEKHNPSLLERLKTSDSVEDAATAFLREYEKCKDLDREEIERVSAAKQIYEVFQEYQSPVE